MTLRPHWVNKCPATESHTRPSGIYDEFINTDSSSLVKRRLIVTFGDSLSVSKRSLNVLSITLLLIIYEKATVAVYTRRIPSTFAFTPLKSK